jgi:ABC-type glycerol-3-phosphate transport system substrate-binding protein
MKKMRFKKTFSVLLAASMALTLCACGGGSGSGDGTDGADGGQSGSGTTAADSSTRYFRADYLDNLPDNSFFNSGNGGGSVVFSGDKAYYSYYNDDYTEQTVCAYDILTGENTEYYTSQSGSGDGGVFAESISLNQYTPTADGGLLLLISSSQLDESTVDMDKYENTTKEDVVNYIYQYWGLDTYEAAEEYFDNYLADTMTSQGETYGELLLSYEATSDNYIRHNYCVKVDASGEEVSRVEVETSAENSYCEAIGSDADGNVFVAMEEWSDDSDTTYILAFDSEGNALGKIDTSGSYISKLVNTADGKCGYLTWASDGENYCLSILDPATLSSGEEIKMGSGYVSDCVALDDHTFLYNGDRGLKQYDTETQETENYLNWLDCNISSSSVSSFGVLSDGRVAVYIQSWGSSTYSVDIAVLDEISAEEAASVKQINVACFYMDTNTESAAIEFNKKHTDYHINVTSYYDYNSDVDYQDALDSFVASISSDQSIDVVNFSTYSQMLEFAQKGLLIDLNGVLADDADLGGGKILPNIINACTFDDKLVALPNYFSVSTLVGKASDVGTTPGWTIADLKKMYDSKEPGTQVLAYNTKDEAFNMCISLGYDQFLDLENKTCNFNTQEFIDVLEFVSLFPDEYNYDEEVDITEQMHNGQVLLYATNIPDFGEMQMLATIFGDDLTYIGYPTSSGNGTMMYFNGISGITKYCEEPELAWEFLRESYLTDDDAYYDSSYFNGSILQEDFDKYFDNATNPDNYGGSWGWGNYETEIHAPSQEEVDQVKDIILNSTAVSGAVPSGILNIIEEEAAAYFSGQKTAADVAANIQSRMEIYLSETM